MQDYTESVIQWLPASRDQYPVSASTDEGFRCSGMDRLLGFMQLWGLLTPDTVVSPSTILADSWGDAGPV